MKRTLSLILVLVCLLSATLSSCSDNTADTETKSSENTSAESEGTETEAETETETELTLNLPEADFGDGLTITDLMVRCGLVSSKGEARRLIDQGGVMVNDVKVAGATQGFTADDVKKGDFVIKKGKKTFHKVICK